MASSPIIAVIGSLNVDLVSRVKRIPAAGETLTASSFDIGSGGKGANQAVACARLSQRRQEDGAPPRKVAGMQVRMIGAVGQDQFAGGLLEGLERDGVDVGGVRRLEGQKTGVSVIVVEEDSGENRIMFSPNANYAFSGEESLVPEDASVVLFQLEFPLEAVLHNIKQAKSKGIQVILNPAPAVLLPDEAYRGLDHLIMNETEAAILSGRDPASVDVETDWTSVASDFLDRGVKNVVITLGAQGVFYQTAARRTSSLPGKRAAARKVESVVDTTAAGDTFVGAYAVQVANPAKRSYSFRGFDIDDAIGFAVGAAAVTVQRMGAQSSIPWLDEL
ncbi:putative ribokinase [Coniosporium apollinis]|uniref:Ribokinase n=1 Tax=Coniosporium apollinis TaxID=61459 RepID=A0ABQ9NMV2_9PEZI|nr:putative ribokinase [Coniosporium apollinis]